MNWKQFVSKWQMRLVDKPSSITMIRPDKVYSVEFKLPIMADQNNPTWTKSWSEDVKKVVGLKVDEFLTDYYEALRTLNGGEG